MESLQYQHRRSHRGTVWQSQEGFFAVAHGSTLFLDEVGELSLDLQAKLLTIIDTGEYRSVGSTKLMKADVRIIAATLQPIEEMKEAGAFRDDLYNRLRRVLLLVPPLRDWSEDVPFLVHLFMKEIPAVDSGIQPAQGVSTDAMNRLVTHNWPGNVRELHSVIEETLPELEEDRIIHSYSLRGEGFSALVVPRSLKVSQDVIRTQERSIVSAAKIYIVNRAAEDTVDTNIATLASLTSLPRSTVYNKLSK